MLYYTKTYYTILYYIRLVYYIRLLYAISDYIILPLLGYWTPPARLRSFRRRRKRVLAPTGAWAFAVAIFCPFSQFCEIGISLLSLQKQPNTALNLFQRGVEYGKYGFLLPAASGDVQAAVTSHSFNSHINTHVLLTCLRLSNT